MSTKMRYGNDVWKGYLAASHAAYLRAEKWVMVGEIAALAGVAKATARKYLRMLSESGDIELAESGEYMMVRAYPVEEQ